MRANITMAEPQCSPVRLSVLAVFIVEVPPPPLFEAPSSETAVSRKKADHAGSNPDGGLL